MLFALYAIRYREPPYFLYDTSQFITGYCILTVQPPAKCCKLLYSTSQCWMKPRKVYERKRRENSPERTISPELFRRPSLDRWKWFGRKQRTPDGREDPSQDLHEKKARNLYSKALRNAREKRALFCGDEHPELRKIGVQVFWNLRRAAVCKELCPHTTCSTWNFFKLSRIMVRAANEYQKAASYGRRGRAVTHGHRLLK